MDDGWHASMGFLIGIDSGGTATKAAVILHVALAVIHHSQHLQHPSGAPSRILSAAPTPRRSAPMRT